MTDNNFIKSLLAKGFKYNEEGENGIGEGFLRIWKTEDEREKTYELYHRDNDKGPWIATMIDESGSIYYENVIIEEVTTPDKCKYCGGDCPIEDDYSEYICDGYRNDPDDLYS